MLLNKIKQKYISLLLRLFFNKNIYGQLPSMVGKRIIPFLPKPKIIWNNSIDVVPDYFNIRWLDRSRRGEHEPSLDRFMELVLNKGDTYIDVGAQVGLTVVMGAKHVGIDGRVIAIEPDEFNHSVLLNVLKLNKLNNVSVFNIAAGEEDGEALFHSETLSGLNQVSEEIDGVQRKTVITVDTIIKQQKVYDLRFIKIDVDGPDFSVILGAADSIKKYKPAIALECSRYWSRFGYEFIDAWEHLSQLGYFIMLGDRNRDGVIACNSPDVIPDGWGIEKGKAINIYCLHPDRDKKLIEAMINNG